MFVLIQYPMAEPNPVQSTHKGQHWKKLAKKKIKVQADVTVVIVQKEMTKTLPLKILTPIDQS